MIRYIWCFFLLFIFVPNRTLAWGFKAHKAINNAAVFTLPPELFKFYKPHLDYITERAVNADKRRYAFANEACKHYLDADHYEKKVPIDTIPFQWKNAVLKYSEDTLLAYGIGPWHLERIQYQLTMAFKLNDLNLILKLSADLGHYAADLHVPLHATENYNGQLTQQDGIHSLWESRLYELYEPKYDFFVGRAAYISQLNYTIWQRFTQSYAALDSVLGLEKVASLKFPNKFSMQTVGRNTIKGYNDDFCQYYHSLLNGMVERRARASINLIGSLWYTAWVDAGQPDLSNLKSEPIKSDKEEESLIQTLFNLSKIIGRKED